ncbi:hypothetical protein DFH07DRAFT_764572 [Mycena maculata]|uniref:Uncharacterized protein n=1 Tax=Mycena maculata TaxID=230809 RepID=A0AAD7KDE0_9AGAR|nr:hypothetical protein DFH07DRAFT_764572 [Mycena maculata]
MSYIKARQAEEQTNRPLITEVGRQEDLVVPRRLGAPSGSPAFRKSGVPSIPVSFAMRTYLDNMEPLESLTHHPPTMLRFPPTITFYLYHKYTRETLGIVPHAPIPPIRCNGIPLHWVCCKLAPEVLVFSPASTAATQLSTQKSDFGVETRQTHWSSDQSGIEQSARETKRSCKIHRNWFEQCQVIMEQKGTKFTLEDLLE